MQSFFFWKHEQRKKTAQKNTIFLKEKEIRVGAWFTHPLPSFSRIFGIFNLTKPLSITLISGAPLKRGELEKENVFQFQNTIQDLKKRESDLVIF